MAGAIGRAAHPLFDPERFGEGGPELMGVAVVDLDYVGAVERELVDKFDLVAQLNAGFAEMTEPGRVIVIHPY